MLNRLYAAAPPALALRRALLALLIVAAIGCEGADEVVGPNLRPTPAPSRTPTPSGYRIGGKVTRNGHNYRTTVTATSAGRTWTAQSSSSTGLYSFGLLPAGQFEVSASVNYCGTRRQTVTVPPDATVDLAFVLCWRVPDETVPGSRAAAR